MGGFLNALGGKLAERWITLLVLPGALFLAAALTGATLGHRHALDVSLLTRRVTGWEHTPAATSAGGQIVLLGAVLAGAAVAGIVAQAVGRLVELCALAAHWRSWPEPARAAARACVERRRRRWDAAHARYLRLGDQAARARAEGSRLEPEPRESAYRAFARISEQRPEHPTWSGERLAGAARRLRAESGIDLARVWPTVWLVLGDAQRTEITAARTSLRDATTLAGWAVLYAGLGFRWWPAFLVALALAATARAHTRTASDAYARLLEAAVHLHAADLTRPAPSEPEP